MINWIWSVCIFSNDNIIFSGLIDLLIFKLLDNLIILISSLSSLIISIFPLSFDDLCDEFVDSDDQLDDSSVKSSLVEISLSSSEI